MDTCMYEKVVGLTAESLPRNEEAAERIRAGLVRLFTLVEAELRLRLQDTKVYINENYYDYHPIKVVLGESRYDELIASMSPSDLQEHGLCFEPSSECRRYRHRLWVYTIMTLKRSIEEQKRTKAAVS